MTPCHGSTRPVPVACATKMCSLDSAQMAATLRNGGRLSRGWGAGILRRTCLKLHWPRTPAPQGCVVAIELSWRRSETNSILALQSEHRASFGRTGHLQGQLLQDSLDLADLLCTGPGHLSFAEIEAVLEPDADMA